MDVEDVEDVNKMKIKPKWSLLLSVATAVTLVIQSVYALKKSEHSTKKRARFLCFSFL